MSADPPRSIRVHSRLSCLRFAARPDTLSHPRDFAESLATMSVQTMTMAEPPKPLDTKTWTPPSQDKSNTYENPSKPTGPDGEFSGNIKVSQKSPTHSDLRAVDNLPVLDADRKSIPFKSLYDSQENRRVLIIFIRHFFCGVRPPLHFHSFP